MRRDGVEEWKECKLGEICTKITDGSHFSPQACQTGYPMFSVEDMLEYGFDYSNCKHISAKDFESMKNGDCVPQKGDILVAKDGSFLKQIFECKETKEEAILSSIAMFRPNQDFITPTFLCYLLKSPKVYNYIASNCVSGSALPRIVLKDFKKVSMQVPPLPTQQKIAAILSSLDDKIELNNKINTNLEQQAQALFKNWFVDFELFGGKMPEGWKEADIYSIANIIYGSPFASKLFNTEKNGKPIIRIRDLKDQHSDVYTPEERDDAYLIQPKDIVVGMDGEFRLYIWGSEPGWLNQRVCVFENKRPKGKAFLYFSIKPLLDVVEKTQVATTVIHIGKKDFDKFQIILPTEEILDKFDELTESILDQIVANRLENRRLSELRDALLPKLMNGEVEV